MNQTFVLKGEPTLMELLNIFYYQTFRKRIVQGILIFLSIVSIFRVIVEFALAVNTKWYMVFFNLLLAPIFLVAFIYVVGFLVTFLLIKLKPTIFKNVTNKFTHWGMERLNEEAQIAIPWSKFLKYRETKKYILLYITKDDAFVIQKKLFDSNEQLEDFRLLLSEKISCN